MNKLIILSALILILFTACNQNKALVEFKSDQFIVGINNKGNINQLTDVETGNNYISTDTISPLLSIRIDSQMFYPQSATVENNILTFKFEGGLEAKVKAEEKESHIAFELVEFNKPENVELIVWGPVPNTINKIIGETVGVVRGEDFAIGIQTLNPKTLGGYPWTDNDCTPQFDIFEQDDYSDLSEKNKRGVLYRVETAKPENFGSTLQAYCRNRNKERIISNLNHERFVSPVFDDGGFIGSKIAIFGCPVEETLETIGKIEVAEGLPHPTIDGEWGKQANTASAAYFIYSFNEHNIDEAIAYTKKAGLRYLYHGGPFKNWGHFELNEKQFPNGWDGMKACVEKAEKEGIHVGVHTLSNFTTTNDPYVTPVPDPRLGKVGTSVLTEDIDASQTEIRVESPDFFNQYKNNNLHGVMIGEELIRYGTVSETAPWKLLNCERGAWETKASAHKKGDKAAKLADHGYKTFLTNPELSIEQAERLAELYNYCGLRQISFDGLEGNRSTGMGNYGEILFTTTWWDNLSPEIKKHTIIDASRTTHYFWHIYSRMNWGEPWYASFRESQTDYRMKNQKYFSRNLMPGMLGWFSMRENTPVEDIEWMLARSAAYNAGYAFSTNESRIKTNGQTDEILRLIGEWEKARMTDAFTEEQKERMKDINNEFTLETLGPNHWSLRQIHSFKFKHEAKVRQPGEPLFSTFQFESPEEDAAMNFIITAQEATISAIKVEIDNSREIVLPVQLKDGESLNYKGNNKAIVFDKFLNPIKEIEINPELLKTGKGSHSAVFDCSFSDKGKEPLAKFEVRIPGKAEEIGNKN
ncbi:MAG: hypothetical protein ABFS16_10840 [Bacteroidota bacterium]